MGFNKYMFNALEGKLLTRCLLKWAIQQNAESQTEAEVQNNRVDDTAAKQTECYFQSTDGTALTIYKSKFHVFSFFFEFVQKVILR